MTRLMVATEDWHPADHLSFAAQLPGCAPGDRIVLGGIDQVLWPAHCVQGTDLDTRRLARVFEKGTDRRIDS